MVANGGNFAMTRSECRLVPVSEPGSSTPELYLQALHLRTQLCEVLAERCLYGVPVCRAASAVAKQLDAKVLLSSFQRSEPTDIQHRHREHAVVRAVARQALLCEQLLKHVLDIMPRMRLYVRSGFLKVFLELLAWKRPLSDSLFPAHVSQECGGAKCGRSERLQQGQWLGPLRGRIEVVKAVHTIASDCWKILALADKGDVDDFLFTLVYMAPDQVRITPDYQVLIYLLDETDRGIVLKALCLLDNELSAVLAATTESDFRRCAGELYSLAVNVLVMCSVTDRHWQQIEDFLELQDVEDSCLLATNSLALLRRKLVLLFKAVCVSPDVALPIDRYRLNLYLDEILYLMSAQDDLLIQFMLSNLFSYLYNERELLNPHKVFLRYLGMQNFSEQELMDQLMSSVEMLLYLLKYLKLVAAEWARFVATIAETSGTKRRRVADEPGPSTSSAVADECNPVERVMATLIRLNLLLQRLNSSSLLPFEADPLLKLLDAIEALYETPGEAGDDTPRPKILQETGGPAGSVRPTKARPVDTEVASSSLPGASGSGPHDETLIAGQNQDSSDSSSS
ncbi:protein lines-like [Tropilaelaps mercedesae]|uniref:Protein lines-like n=1 Tax=Tropilaelaps mercedesae TaxID=418985 RepID=A0A1V9WYF3_9ACAR|nr:protein lines-like [Tropilaelaps mercedesae]